MLDQHTMNRLALIRYGNLIATEQALQPEPMCAHALLGLHDSVELFLQLSSEHLNVPSQPKQFMDFWTALSPLISSGQLSHRIGMERINKARVGVKHYGNLPSAAQIHEFQYITSSFFEENTPIIFGIPFDAISMVDLVYYDAARSSLKSAEQQIVNGDFAGAMCSVAVSYRQLIDELNRGYLDRYYRSPFYFGQDFAFDSAFFRRTGGTPGNQRQEEFEDKLIAAVESMQPVAEAMALGIDYRKFAKFSLMRPAVLKMMNGEYTVQIVQGMAGSIDWPPSREASQFCLDFVIECAVKMRGTDISTMPQNPKQETG